MHYTLFIDESGDQGLDRVRQGLEQSGASPYMTLGACLVPQSEKNNLTSLHDGLASEFGKAVLHCNELNHFQVARFARMVGLSARVRLFAFISKKSTLGSYKNEIAGKGQDQRYYNKCVQYLLERVGEFMLLNDIPSQDLSIIFERRERHSYESLRSYIKSINRSPIDERTARFLGKIDPMKITDQSKEQQVLLSFADLVAYSSFQAVNESKKNCGIPEQRYLRELKDKFFCDRSSGSINDMGIKLLKMKSMNLDDISYNFFTNFKSKIDI